MQERVARFEARGRPVPDYLTPPPLLPGYEDWWRDFWELCTDRSIGQVVGPIPAASIDRHTAGWCASVRDMFRSCIRAMDAVYLTHVRNDGAPDAPEPSARDTFRAAMKRGPDK